jgi:protocatechuate 3,4-dioxygenase beta subunit
MNDKRQRRPPRRRFLEAALALPAAGLLLGPRGALLTSVRASSLAPTPACGDDDDLATPSQTEGPYFKPRSPERTSLLDPGVSGTPLVIAGQVLSTTCRPVSRALLDFWQADDAGRYDNEGFRLRGHQFTDETGRFRLETILPAAYARRTRHVHVKVQAPNRPVLTTQLYFPGEPRNARDRIFSPALLMDVRDTASSRMGTFTFVVEA